ncbi:hypothetical protein GCM10025867_41860 [Frondihabitans sucicola]|uniref:Polysaccharide biosynthesis protein n=1 Tax=Frondihabitans sucicola TaxID=1268041 RepID=A0ABM8GU00_9MICO|nr:oligosaccharide flippase family protein [Frondihabitans sucicola]BDZ51945.1 hypothetical protein GCM10025867_41860 [Frondihabitans sucicola]
MTTTETPPVRSGGMRAVGSTAIIKVLVMGLSGILGILTSRVILHSFGTDAYAQYGLLSSFPTLLPFADLGIAAVIINEVAGSKSPRTDDAVRRTIVTALRTLMISGGIMVVVAIVITVFGWWPLLLGKGLMGGGNLTAGLCLVIFGIAVPLTVGQRILVGLKKTNVQVASQAIVAPFMLLVISALAMLAIPAGTFLSIVSYVGNALLSVLCLWIASRALSPQIGQAFRLVFKVRAYKSVAVLGLAWPMLVQTLAQPIAFQTDRILLSHVGTSHDLAQYNLASQLFGLVLQTIAAAGVALWPIYAGHRAAGRIESPTKPTFWFLGEGSRSGDPRAAVSVARRLHRRRQDRAVAGPGDLLRGVRRPAGGEIPHRHVHDRQGRTEVPGGAEPADDPAQPRRVLAPHRPLRCGGPDHRVGSHGPGPPDVPQPLVRLEGSRASSRRARC